MGKQPTSRTIRFFSRSVCSLPNLKKIILTSIFFGQIGISKSWPTLTPNLKDYPYQNQEHALRTLYMQFAFVLHSFCALVNHILHMCKMCVTSKILAHAQNVRRRYTLQYVCSLRTIVKICAKYAQFAHNLKICAQYVQFAHIMKKKRKKKSSAPVAGHPSKHWAGPMFEYRCFQCGMVSDTYSYSRRPFICAATLPKVSVLIVCNGNSSMSWVRRSGSFKYN